MWHDGGAPERALDEVAGPNAVFTVDTGMCAVWGARYLHAAEGRRLLGSFNHGSMANALPQAIGAQLAQGGVRVEDPAQLRAAIERELESLKQAKGFALAMTKMAFTDQLHDVLGTVMANWRNV